MIKDGKKGWSIDHIIPCSYFDLTKEENQRICFHFFNLQPLWERDNIIKYNVIPDNYLEHIEIIKGFIKNYEV